MYINGISINANMLVSEKYREDMQSILKEVESKFLDIIEKDFKGKIMFLNGNVKFIKIEQVK